jgi:zinc D-Ala-D-Ala dipeptidase
MSPKDLQEPTDMLKPYHQVAIQDCGESLVPIPTAPFVLAEPHPYAVLGAPYGQVSPFYLREGVLVALTQAQAFLAQQQPNWRIFVFDAYRPIPVQQFMVDYTFAELLRRRGLEQTKLSPAELQPLWAEVYALWAMPSQDPLTPPPHSTGAAVDLTLVDGQGQRVWMGSDIDELSPRSQPNYFSNWAENSDFDPQQRQQAELAHRHRQCLNWVMTQAGFQRHPGEWWHFSLGDQLWAWQLQQQGQTGVIARYGRYRA